jgi:phosphoglucosamine mutase
MDALFGTDGIRATVGHHPVTPQSFLQLGWALGSWIKSGKVLIGKDTRLSGYMLESALQAGLSAAGIDVYLSGPLPTPAVAYLTQSLNAQAGLVISASHNPFYDNGLKIFSNTGLKLTTQQQTEITELYHKKLVVVSPEKLGKAHRLHDASGRYIEFLKRSYPSLSLEGVTIMLDCAHGAAYQIAPQIFKELKASVQVIHDSPNGYNINDQSGVIHPEAFEELVQSHQPMFAFAFDGDADRLAVYVDGKKLDPNHVLLALYDYYQRDRFVNTGIIGTHLTNTAIASYLANQNIPYMSTDVGDRNLIYAALSKGWFIAGEPSGHYLLMDKLKTADALLTALALVDYFTKTKKRVSFYQENIPLSPSASYTFSTVDGESLLSSSQVIEQLDDIRRDYPHIRIIIRASGTEPVIRFYLEGPSVSQLDALAENIFSVLSAYQEKLTGISNKKVIVAELEAPLG